MMTGIDISGWNKNLVTSELLHQQDFVMMKATEGKTGKDKCLDIYYDMLHGATDGKPDKDKCYGFYHYSRAEKWTAKEEAENFLNKVGHHAGEAIFALDWEGDALSQPWEKAREWLDYVYAKTGVRPIIYTSATNTPKMQIILDGNYGLWVAHWGASKPKTGVYPFWAMWQYNVDRVRNLDLDKFNGTKETFKKYCRRT